MKQTPRITIVGIAWMLAFSSVTSPSPAAATEPSYSGTITGVFDTPVLTGAFLDAGARRPVARDNTTTAGASGVATSSLTWGDTNGGTLAPSTLAFTGNSFSDVAPGQVFPLGTLSYFNGQNPPPSLIFGLSMHLSAGDGIAPFTGPVDVVSTVNANLDRVADADVLVFSKFEIPSTLAAFEGTTVTAIVYGKIVGDSELEITGLSLAPGEASHGCVAAGPFVESRPCGSACGSVCSAVTLALAAPLCGSEQLPADLNARIGQALRLLSRESSRDSERKAKKRVRLAMTQLHRSAAIAVGTAKRGRISAECAEAVGRAIGNAQSQAEPLLSTR
jgi:hypothetical protein